MSYTPSTISYSSHSYYERVAMLNIVLRSNSLVQLCAVLKILAQLQTNNSKINSEH